MTNTQLKKNVLWLSPGPTYRPDLVEFKDRFIMLSSKYQGEVYSWTNDPKFSTYEMGSFTFRGYVPKKYPNKLLFARNIIKQAIKYNKKKPVDLIVCYDPVLTGTIGAFLKLLFGCKLVIELNNSDVAEAIKMEVGDNVKAKIKILLFKLFRSFSLFFSDGIKLLTPKQLNNLEDKHKKKTVFCFHDFVPTHYFTGVEQRMDNYILFVGYPFHRKGIDLLVSAFDNIKDEFPDTKLILIGHRLKDEANTRLGEWDSRIIFKKAMFYDELREYFLNCYCFVLPSREEGMGRVLLEAMASGKAVVGANVGGIPSLIKNESNGLLFEKEDIEGLSNCLAKLLRDRQLSQSLGENGRNDINNTFSSQKYIQHFDKMAGDICSNR